MGGGHTAVDGWVAVGLVKDLKQSIVAARHRSDKDGAVTVDWADFDMIRAIAIGPSNSFSHGQGQVGKQVTKTMYWHMAQ